MIIGNFVDHEDNTDGDDHDMIIDNDDHEGNNGGYGDD